MKKMNRVLTVSMIAILAVSGANAKIVSETMLNGAISDMETKTHAAETYQPKGNYATSTQGGKADNAIQGVKVNGTALTPDANKVVSMTVPTVTDTYSATGTAAVSGKAVASAITDMETKTHASQTYQPKGNYLTAHQDISGKENTSNKVATEEAWIEANGAGQGAVKYPSLSAVDERITSKLDDTVGGYISKGSATVPVYFNASGEPTPITSYSGKAATAGTADKAAADGAGNNIASTYATKSQITDLDSALGTGNVTGGNVVTEVVQTDGKVTVTHGKAVNAVSDLANQTGNVVTAVTLNADGKTINVAKGITALTSADIANKADKGTKLADYGITDAYTKTETGTQITNAINNLDVTSVGGNGTVIKAISESNGKISATAGAISNTDIASNAAIEPSKIATSASNRFVTDTEKNTWNAKQGALPDVPSVAPTSPDGTYVLTAKKVNSVITYAWEDIGR